MHACTGLCGVVYGIAYSVRLLVHNARLSVGFIRAIYNNPHEVGHLRCSHVPAVVRAGAKQTVIGSGSALARTRFYDQFRVYGVHLKQHRA